MSRKEKNEEKDAADKRAEEIAEKHARREFIKNILNESIKKNAEEIIPIISNGGIACVVFELDDEVVDVAKDLGWDGKTPVFEMREETRKMMAFRCGSIGDMVTKRWLENDRNGRIFLMAHLGTLLVNYDYEEGYSLEPGSTDKSWAS